MTQPPPTQSMREQAERMLEENAAARAITDPAELAAYLRRQAAYEKTLTPEELATFRDGMVCT